MRILIFSLFYRPIIGGAEVAVQEITDRIDPSDIQFDMVTLRFNRASPKIETVGNVRVHRVGPSLRNAEAKNMSHPWIHLGKYFYQFLAPVKAMRLHREEPYDAVWAITAHSTGIAAAVFKTFRRDVKYLLTLQDGESPEYIEGLARPLWPVFKRAFTSADQVQAISSFLLDWARRMGARGRAIVIPNAVDTAHFTNVRSSTGNRFFEKPPGEIILVTTSRLATKNAVDDVIRALAYMSPAVTLVIAGGGPEEPSLRSLVEQLNLHDRVRFLGDVGREDIPSLLASCDIFVRPSRSEGQGISFIEAMAVGLPVIATQEGGIRDFLFDPKRNPEQATTGWAVDRDSPVQIAEAVEHIIGHPDEVAAVTRTARAMVLAKYDWDKIASDMRTLLLGLV